MRLSITPMNKENLLGSDHEKTVHELQIQILELKSSLFESKFKVESLKKKLKKSQAENKELTQKLTDLQNGTSQLKNENTVLMQDRLGELDARLT